MNLHPRPEMNRSIEVTHAEVVRVRQAFHENEDWYQDLVEHSHDLLCVHDLQGRILSINSTPARLLGYSVEEMLGLHMRELTPPELRFQFDDYLKGITENGQASGLLVVLTRSGERREWGWPHTRATDQAPPGVVA